MSWLNPFARGDPFDPPSDVHCWPNQSDPTQRNFMVHHGVNVMEAIKTGAAWYRVSGDDADRAHNFIIRYQAAHRIDFNGAREACYEQWRRQGREL